METDLIFVYGSLLSKGINHHLMSKGGAVNFMGASEIQGSLYMIDWYPGLKLGGPNPVIGEVYQMTNPQATILLLDEYEDAQPQNPDRDYERVIITCLLGEKEKRCWTYEYLRPIEQAAMIPGGDFLSFLNSKN